MGKLYNSLVNFKNGQQFIDYNSLLFDIFKGWGISKGQKLSVFNIQGHSLFNHLRNYFSFQRAQNKLFNSFNTGREGGVDNFLSFLHFLCLSKYIEDIFLCNRIRCKISMPQRQNLGLSNAFFITEALEYQKLIFWVKERFIFPFFDLRIESISFRQF